MRASDARVTVGATATKGSSISTGCGSSAARASAAAAPSASRARPSCSGTTSCCVEVEARGDGRDVELLLVAGGAVEERPRVDARLEGHVEVALAGPIGQVRAGQQVVVSARGAGRGR